MTQTRFARLAALAGLTVWAIGCSGHAAAPQAAAPSAAAVAVPALRWVPDRPAYVFASPSVAEGQRSLRDALDALGTAGGFDARDLGAVVQGLLGVDALHADPLAAIGVDVRGSWAVFSDDLSPTVVVHLSAPAQMAAFLAHQRERGLTATSTIVDRTEVFSAELLGGFALSWAIDGDWMWIHASRGARTGEPWFEASHGAHAAGWSDNWTWAERAVGAARGAQSLLGFLDLHGAVAGALARLPDALACARQIPSVSRIAISVSGDDHHIASRVAIDAATAGLAHQLVAPPSGWDAATAHAAISGQWNLDLAAVRTWLAPCLAASGGALAGLDDGSLRTARGALLAFDPESTSGSGAIALDLTSSAFFAHQLDRVPLRSALERARTFGSHRGFVIEIPFGVTVEYVLEPTLMIAALGEGLIGRIVAPAPAAAAPPPILALDVAPPMLSAEAWAALFHILSRRELSGAPGPGDKRMAERLLRWRALHLAVTAEPTGVMVSASAERR